MRVGLAVGASLATISVLEVSFRIYNYGWVSLSPREMRSVHPLDESGLVRATGLVRPDYELKPNSVAHFKMRAFKTNSFGEGIPGNRATHDW